MVYVDMHSTLRARGKVWSGGKVIRFCSDTWPMEGGDL